MINGELIIDNFAGGGGASTDLHSMNQIITDYPIGTKVRPESDRLDEAPREVAGYRKIGRYDYLLFTDGYMAYVGRVVG